MTTLGPLNDSNNNNNISINTDNDTTNITSFVDIVKPMDSLSLKKRHLKTQPSLGTALTNLMNTFHMEAQNQEKLFEIFEEHKNNENFANINNCLNWNKNEVCFWLQKINMDEYINNFYSNDNINGKYLIYNIDISILVNVLNVSLEHAKIIIEFIHKILNAFIQRIHGINHV